MGASLLQGEALHFVGAPPSGRFLVVCGGDRDGGVAPTGDCPAFCGIPALGAMGGGLRGLIATGASLLQGEVLDFVGAPPSGRWVVVCEA